MPTIRDSRVYELLHLQRVPRTANLLRSLLGLLTLAALLSVQSPLLPYRSAVERQEAPQSPSQTLLGKLPLYFIENRGQLDRQVGYYAQGRDTTLYFTPQGVTFALSQPQPPPSLPLPNKERALLRPTALRAEPQPTDEPQRWVLKLDFVGANPAVTPRGQELLSAKISYFTGPREQWQTGLSTYCNVVYPELWPGIDLVYSGATNRLKYTFVVKPGADPRQIKLAYRGANAVTLTEGGQLQVTTPLGGFTDDKPYAYQEVNGQRVAVAAAYALEQDTAADTQGYGFHIGPYDTSQELILDPAVLIYASFIGGERYDFGNDVAVDGDGNAYVVGTTISLGTFPMLVGPDLTQNDICSPLCGDAFVAKVNAAGTAFLYVGYLGGANLDQGRGIAVDGDGNAYVTGDTESDQATFPVTDGPDLTYNGFGDAFVAKVNADGTELLYAGYLGGSGQDIGSGIAINTDSNAYVTGFTTSTEATFPVVGGPDLTYNGILDADAFVAKVTADGTGLLYAGYLGGSDDDGGYGIAIDADGNAYVTGFTNSTEATFPVVGGPDPTHNGGTDAFVAKVNAAGTGLVYAGYIGGDNLDSGNGIAVDAAANAYVTGETDSTQATFPVTGGPSLIHNGGTDAFVAKVNAAGTGLVYAGYIGGDDSDSAHDIATDGDGNAYVIGFTASTEATFPVVEGPDLTYNGAGDAFVAKVNADGTGLTYAGYIGGNRGDGGAGIAVDNAGNAYVTGITSSDMATFPVTLGPDLTENNFINEAFVAKIDSTTEFPPLEFTLFPTGRAVTTGSVAVAIARVHNTGTTAATDVGISLPGWLPPVGSAPPVGFIYQALNEDGTAFIADANTPITIPPGGTQLFVLGLLPPVPLPFNAPYYQKRLPFIVKGTNTVAAPIVVGGNTLWLRAAVTALPDPVAIAVTCGSDDGEEGVVNLPEDTSFTTFAIAVLNLGAAGQVRVEPSRGEFNLPLGGPFVCQFDPQTGCLPPIGGAVTVEMDTGEVAFFAVFVQGVSGQEIKLERRTHRVLVQFRGNSLLLGEVSVPVRTHTPACAL